MEKYCPLYTPHMSPLSLPYRSPNLMLTISVLVEASIVSYVEEHKAEKSSIRRPLNQEVSVR